MAFVPFPCGARALPQRLTSIRSHTNNQVSDWSCKFSPCVRALVLPMWLAEKLDEFAATKNAQLSTELSKLFEQDLETVRASLCKPLPMGIIATPSTLWLYRSMCQPPPTLEPCYKRAAISGAIASLCSQLAAD
eukprot:14164-Heterococcus_DN1.PRE.1